jgi:hypothetical protein
VTRDAGFAVMDVSVNITDDPKVRKLFRLHPDVAPTGFMAYVGLMAESWKQGRRLSIEDGWPTVLPFSRPALDALKHVRLLDAKGLIPAKTWTGWFGIAAARRGLLRERWRRSNDARRVEPTAGPPRGSSAVAATSPRGHRAVTASPVPSRTVPSKRDTPPPPAERGRRKDRTDPRSLGDSPRQNGHAPRDLGTSPRQIRQAEKTGPTPLRSILRAIGETKP